MRTLVDRETDRAILFMHGLIGDPESSFRNPSSAQSWADIIAGDQTPLTAGGSLSDFAVYSVDYHDTLAASPSIEKVVGPVTRAVTDSAIWSRHRYVYVIAHSLGGIIAKRLLIDFQNSQRTLLFQRVVGVALLGVPSEGAEYGRIKSDTGMSEEQVSRYFGWNEFIVRDLAANSTILETLANQWAELRRARSGKDFPLVSCAFEGKPEDFGGLLPDDLKVRVRTVVPHIYSEKSCDGATTPIMVTHLALPKPRDAQDHVHTWMRARVNEALHREFRTVAQRLYVQGPPRRFSADVAFFNRQHRKVDDATNLPSLFEEVQVEDADRERLERFRPRGYPFKSNTLSRLFEDVQRENRCLKVGFNANRSVIRLGFDGSLKECGTDLVCPDVPCP